MYACIPLRVRGRMSHTVVMEGDTASWETVNREVTLTRSHIVCFLMFSGVYVVLSNIKRSEGENSTRYVTLMFIQADYSYYNLLSVLP